MRYLQSKTFTVHVPRLSQRRGGARHSSGHRHRDGTCLPSKRDPLAFHEEPCSYPYSEAEERPIDHGDADDIGGCDDACKIEVDDWPALHYGVYCCSSALEQKRIEIQQQCASQADARIGDALPQSRLQSTWMDRLFWCFLPRGLYRRSDERGARFSASSCRTYARGDWHYYSQ